MDPILDTLIQITFTGYEWSLVRAAMVLTAQNVNGHSPADAELLMVLNNDLDSQIGEFAAKNGIPNA